MSALTDITELAQDAYFTVNGTESTATGTSLTKFLNNFIRGFNLFIDEYETEAYWNNLRENGYELATISNTTDFSFPLSDDYRTPVFNQYKYVKVISSDGIKLASFKLVDPSQSNNDDPSEGYHPDRATFVGRNVVLSRAPNANEVGSTLVLDVILKHPRITLTDSTAIDLLPSRQLAVLGISKNVTLSNVTKVALSPSFTQKYGDELKKCVIANNATNENYDAQYDDYGNITGNW